MENIPTWFYILILFLCLCCLSTASAIISRFGAQAALNNEVRTEQISGATPRRLNLCPTYPSTWKTIDFTNGKYCIEPGSTPTVDTNNNLTGAIVGECTGTSKTLDGNNVCLIK